jgi:hypothetical protein
MEQEVLTILLRGSQPVVWCPARSIPRRLPADRRATIAAGRLLIVSPFAASRPTDRLAWHRNHYVHQLAAVSLVAHAAPGGTTEELVSEWTWDDVPLLTLDDPANANLIDFGALPITPRGESWPDVLLRLTRPAAANTRHLPLFAQK